MQYFKKSAPIPQERTPKEQQKRYQRLKWQIFFSATFGYGFYYVCRLSLNVVKKPIVDSGFLTKSQLGIIGSALFFAYAVGKFVNGFLADHSNIKRFMSAGLFISVLANLIMGFTDVFLFFVICGVSMVGYNQWELPQA
ncbi:MFS transporter [Capnocytophaga catalasegens]|uniref:MFS transporter n=1 Tax=Capnocytophaga catalasegens TaxID=1004260 RepID=UPI00222E16F7|nr:MFS transporter [Capnocytophaga catalasegens]